MSVQQIHEDDVSEGFVSEEEEYVEQNADTPQVEEEEEEQGQENTTSLITHALIFPDYPVFDLPAGIPIRSGISFSYHGKQNLTLYYVVASLFHNKSAGLSVHNFTPSVYQTLIPRDIAVSVQYNFWPHHSFAERPFRLVLQGIFADKQNNEHVVVIYNKTHTFLSLPTSNFDIQLLSILLILLGAISAGAYYVREKYFKTKPLVVKTETTTVETGTKDQKIDYNWLPKEIQLGYEKSKKDAQKQKKNQ